eukprot:CAMPEP_0116045658 /NCGR_PEP_ID=MMETSP0321-20121206/27754_1 /TAXON_ID=163516 /ORGANISM="Leptocylindrus danicus var. danicus, Strain B650" /LENGTH=319 /DNA_ID=CAMNT_0003527043 /DNA_START=155 /DNA_END=1114 /DNA_ORIENTATION=-
MNVAVVTLVTTSSYVPGAEVLAESLQRVNAIGDRVLLYVPPEEDDRSDITVQHLRDLELAGWNKLQPLTTENGKFSKCKGAELVANVEELSTMARYWGTCSKLALWSLVEYDKVIYIDADSIVLNNFDHLYDIIQQSKGINFAAQQSPNCPAEADSMQYVPESCQYQTAFLILKPYEHIYDYLKKQMDNSKNIFEGELPWLNGVISSFYALPMWTSIAQTNNVRPWIEKMQGEKDVDWSQVISFDFTGTSKPWITYALQKESGNLYRHPVFGSVKRDSIYDKIYMHPQRIWNEYYEVVIERKKEKNECHHLMAKNSLTG